MNNQRREFIKKAGMTTLGAMLLNNVSSALTENDDVQIMSVNGPVSTDDLGIILPHEHVLSRFGVAPEEPASYDTEDVVSKVVPYLKYLKSIGCTAIVCCTTAYFGRNVNVLKKISDESGVQIITNTGFYGAANDRYVPEFAYSSSSTELAEIWIKEWKNGINGTGIKPGFLKTAVDDGPLSEIDAKLVEAAAITHLETGLTLQIHTSNNPSAAKKQLEILEGNGVSPEAWVWVHAQNVEDIDELLNAAGKGAWISLDHLFTPYYANQQRQGDNNLENHLEKLKKLKEAGFLGQVLLSHDGSTYPPEGVVFRPLDILFNTFIPIMKAAGFSEMEIKQLTEVNPKKAFTIKKRLM